ncbi:MAG TPA: hypothetical protein VGK51_10415 [Actinomycetota bacterium]
MLSVGLGKGGGDQRGTAAGSGGLKVGAGLGEGLRVGLGVSGSTMGAASGAYVDGDGDGATGDRAAAWRREVLHPPAARRMAMQAVAIRFVNEALPR